MFIIIPLALISVSVIGILIIVWRKLPFLKKLDVEAMASNGSNLTWHEFFHDMLPEVGDQQHKLKQFKDLWFSELEKFIRKTRLLTLKLDNFAAVLIGKIRRVNRQKPMNGGNRVNGNVEITDIFENRVKAVPKNNTETSKDPGLSMADLKQKEQALIIRIAKDPKSWVLYEELTDVYLAMNQYKDAEESIKAAIDLNPKDENLKKKLSSILEKINS